MSELVLVDATGESGWPYGSEDVAGDGPEAFTQAEQAIDIRTVYVATDERRLWLRAYVASVRAVAPWAITYVFVDSDQNSATGGEGAAPEIDAGLGTDASIGAGYDHMFAVRGDGNLVGLWQHDSSLGQYVEARIGSGSMSAETDRAEDPISIRTSVHGYVQAMIDLELVGLTSACHANLLVRSASGMVGDRAVGRPVPCIPVDQTHDRVSDLLGPRRGDVSAPCVVTTDHTAGQAAQSECATRVQRQPTSGPIVPNRASKIGLWAGLGAILGAALRWRRWPGQALRALRLRKQCGRPNPGALAGLRTRVP